MQNSVLNIPQQPKSPEARGLELMACHRNLVHAVADGTMDVDFLIAWTQGLSDEEWHLMAQAEIDAARYLNKADRRALLKAYDDAPMAGRAR